MFKTVSRAPSSVGIHQHVFQQCTVRRRHELHQVSGAYIASASFARYCNQTSN